MANPLRGYRKKHGLSQQELADKLGVSRTLVAMIETGSRAITGELSITIEKELGIDRIVTQPGLFRRRAA